MQVLKVSFALVGLVVLSSFELAPAESLGRITAKYRATQYEQFLNKFEKVNSVNDILLDVRINQPLPVSEEEFQASNLNRQAVRRVVEKRMLLSDFDLFLPEITHKRKGGLRPNTYEAEYLVKSTRKFDMVIYSAYIDARQYHKSYYLATFSKTGVILAKEAIGVSNQYTYTEAKLNNRWLTTTTVLDGQELPLRIKKFKVEQKGSMELLGTVHPYLDELNKDFKVVTPKNYRLRVE